MILPSMRYGSGITKGKQIRFYGLNRGMGAGDGELQDMRNLTSDHYPLLAVRAPRLRYRALEAPGGLFSLDGLAWVDGTAFCFEGQERGQVTRGKKIFASLGAYIVIFPDKCWYNVDTGEFGSLEANWEGESLTFRDGEIYEEEAKANTISCEGVNWADWFRVGDAVSISGCTAYPGNNLTIIIREIEGEELRFYENSFTMGEDQTEHTETGTMKISRTVPELKYLCENNNRLWGCTENTIYASKPGDIFNWNVYDGLDSDAWALTPGSQGCFTGCISYGGYPIFFKEDVIYKVYGSVPSNFEVMGSATLGLARGSHGSLAIAGEILFYLSNSGVMAYTGGIPQPMGAAFGTMRFKNAVGGSDGLKYYVSMEDAAGSWGLYVYDTQIGIWHMEDESHVTNFARLGGSLYMLNDRGEIWITGPVQDPPEGTEAEGKVEWSAEFADFTEETPNKKGVSKLQLRLELAEGACMEVYLMFDSDGQWHRVNYIRGEGKKRSYYLPIVPKRCDHYRLKLMGTGECRICSIVREFYAGSELKSKWGRN